MRKFINKVDNEIWNESEVYNFFLDGFGLYEIDNNEENDIKPNNTDHLIQLINTNCNDYDFVEV